jgi:hypothetical protein
MKKILKWVLITFASLAVVLFIAFQIMRTQTKKHSPEATVELSEGDLQLSVFYNRPYKKGREIFGGLVPYGEVWRTGANEATTFTTNKDLMIDGQILPAGKYTLWTIPGPDQWTVIFNGKQYSWGVNFNGKPSREPEADVLEVQVPVQTLEQPVEQFTISFEEGENLSLALEWDRTRVAVPLPLED